VTFQRQSLQRKAEISLPSQFACESNRLAAVTAVLRAGVAIALLAALSAPANAISSGLPQELRPAAPIPELSRPASIIRAAKPRTPAATAPAIGTKPPASSLAAKPALGTPEQPAKPKAPLSVLISLDRQQLTLYSGSEPIAHSRVSTGVKGRSTPTGVFSVIQKDRYHRSNLYDDAPMYFMQRITWSGVAMHQGIVPNYPASHGCIRLPEAFAKQLWGTTGVGVRVIITHGEVFPHEISHPRLFTPKAPVVATNINSLEAAKQAWKIAQLGGAVPLMGATASDVVSPPSLDSVPRPAARPAKSSPISVFISRKEGKLFVRKGFEPLLDTPIEIENPDQPLGTHVFSAIGRKDDGTLKWTVVSMSSGKPTPGAVPTAGSVLDRITIPQTVLDRISEMTAPGTSLIVSDHGLGPETGLGTDFIVLTR
jgi:lipoprotein-anchoring transpeptidase ErfK/SrfK